MVDSSKQGAVADPEIYQCGEVQPPELKEPQPLKYVCFKVGKLICIMFA